MLTLITFLVGMMQAVDLPPATHVSGEQLDAGMKAIVDANRIDQMMKAVPVVGGIAKVAVVHRVKPEPTALVHNEVTEIYYVLEGAGTITTGGRLEGAKPTDLSNVGAGMSQSGNHVGGATQHVKPKDVVIVPAGTPHRFSQLDAPISYLVYRFEPTPRK
jgi:mannose-6-phosphate isomerase-like protein (cupin superfamily)